MIANNHATKSENRCTGCRQYGAAFIHPITQPKQLMLRPILHLGLHIIVPGTMARLLFPDRWKTTWLVMMSAMIIDLDHLLANPIYDPNRCGINFHPLHSLPAIAVYALLAAVPKTRLLGFGLTIHIMLDGLDCLWMKII